MSSLELRAVWALHVTGGLTEEIALKLLCDKHSPMNTSAPGPSNCSPRTTSFPSTCSPELPAPGRTRISRRSSVSISPPHCSAFPSMSAGTSWRRLHAHSEDAQDHNLPLMDWYAAEPLPTEGQQPRPAIGGNPQSAAACCISPSGESPRSARPRRSPPSPPALNRVSDDPAHPRYPHRASASLSKASAMPPCPSAGAPWKPN